MVKQIRTLSFVVGFILAYYINRAAVMELVETNTRFVLLLALAYGVAFVIPRGKTRLRDFFWVSFSYFLTTYVYLFIASLLEGYAPNGVLGNLAGTLVFFLAGSPIICLVLAPAILFTLFLDYFITKVSNA